VACNIGNSKISQSLNGDRDLRRKMDFTGGPMKMKFALNFALVGLQCAAWQQNWR